MIYEGINFYPSAFEGRSIEQFIEAHKHQGLSVAQLREVYSLAVPKTAKAKTTSPKQGA